MTFVNRHRSDFCRAVRVLLSVSLFCLVFCWSQPVLSQHKAPVGRSKQVVVESTRAAQVPRKGIPEAGAKAPDESESSVPGIFGEDPTSQMPPMEPIEEPVAMEFTLDWTSYQTHRLKDNSPVEIVLSGNMFCSRNLSWNLWSRSPRGEDMLGWHHMEDVLGRRGPDNAMDIPLTWEVAIGDGPFGPITSLPDNTLNVVFPAGSYAFRVRITSPPLTNFQAGYYRLELGQSITPEL